MVDIKRFRMSSHWLRNNKVILLLLLVIALGSFLRIYDLGAESIWLDEAHSARVSSQTLTSTIAEAASGLHPPLYFVILHFWMGLFGNSEVALRSLSAIFGIISILLIYQVGIALFNREVGLISSFLSAVSHFHIQYSQEARPYTLLLLLSLLSFLFFIQILKHERKWYYPCYLLANILLVYTHVFGLFMVAAQIFFLLLFWTKYSPQRLKLLSMQIATVVAILPLAFLLGSVAISIVEHGFWIPEPSLMRIYDTLGVFAGHAVLLLLLFFCLVIVAPFSIRRMEGQWTLGKPLESLKSISWNIRLGAINEILLLVIWLSLPIVLAFIVSKTITPIYVIRYLIGASPALYLLVARGLNRLNMKKGLYPVLLIIVLLAVPNLVHYYTHAEKQQWREVAQLVELNAQENDVIIFCQDYTQDPFDYYYTGRLEKFGINKKVEDTQEIVAFVDKAISEKQRLWLVLSMAGPNPPIESYLMDRYGNDSVIMERQFIGLRVLLFDLAD